MKPTFNKKKAFTLIELLIVIAIIGILFIVLISKVDFASDKAKATGVQTDFRSFQVAIESVAREHAGLNTFGWDTGDANQDGIRNSYDEGDNGAGGGIAKNGIRDGSEVFTGHKVYDETFTKVFSLKKNGTGSYDREALNRLETAINANLDPKLHITIKDDGEIVMANGAQDPWNKEYHGWYITNAESDKKDRGAIVLYSDGANNEFGSEHSIANGVVTVNVPGNNKLGKDDYSLAVVYTFANGYGEVKTSTSGFSNNQITQGNISNNSGTEGTEGTEDPDVTELLEPGLYQAGAITLAENGDVTSAQDMMKISWDDLLAAGIVHVTNGVVYSNADFDTWENASSDVLDGDLVLPNDGSVTSIGDAIYDEDSGNMAFTSCYKLTGISIPKCVTWISCVAFDGCESLTSINIPNSVAIIDDYAFDGCESLTSIVIPDSVTSIGEGAFDYCTSLTSVTIPNSVTNICDSMFERCTSLTSVVIPDSVTSIGMSAFNYCTSLKSVTIPDSVTSLGTSAFEYCISLESIVIPDSVTSIGEWTFFNCTSLTSVTIPNSITNICNYTFNSCSSLTSVVIPNGVTSIGDSAFGECTNLTSVTIPDTVTSIGWGAFAWCTSLKSVSIPDSVTSINENVFRGCMGLTSATIPDSVTSIGNYAFYDCSNLDSITFNGSIKQWKAITKGSLWNRTNGTHVVNEVVCSDGTVSLT